MGPKSFYGQKRMRSDDSESDEEDPFQDNGDEYVPSDLSFSSFPPSDEREENYGEHFSSEDEELDQNPSTSAASRMPESQQWSSTFEAGERLNFIGRYGLNTRVTVDNGEPMPMNIFQQFFDEEIMELMVTETNRYARQFIENNQLCRNSRMNRWSDATVTEMKNFLGIIIISGLIKFPNMEDYWKKDEIYYHPLFHEINMTYNRFTLILKNWHVSDNSIAPPGDRLYKISNFTKILISNYQAVYTPGEEISVDETMISHKGRLLLKQYNPGEAHKYGIKIYKLCEMSGYVIYLIDNFVTVI